ncbi:MAG: DUF6677 family protein [Planctomycetota bacterium]|jgi:hypothetical protein
MPPPDATPESNDSLSRIPIALTLAWVFPGLGHAYIGETQRAVTLAVTLVTLFTAGLLIGAIDVVDRQNDHLWFVGQAMFGPAAFAVDKTRASLEEKSYIDPTPQSPYHRCIGRVNEIGTLYTTLAGVLNLLAILDLFGRLTRKSQPADPASHSQPDTPNPRGAVITRDNR